MIADTIITAATTQMIKSLVEKVIAPRFEIFLKSIKTDYKQILDRNKDYFGEYYIRTYEKYSIINTLVFHNSQRLLKDIYVAQTLVKENRFEDKEETTRIDGMPKALIKKYKKILITDTAGMGKSTIMKRMFIDLIDNGIEGIGVPIYIELNRLNKDRTVLQEIQDGLSSLSKEFDNDLLLSFIQKGDFIFFLDGYDEISIVDRCKVTKDIQRFISKAGTNNYYVLTSRPEEGLASFGDFQSFKIEPLTKEEAFELLKKYDGGENKVLSGKLVKLLQSGGYDSIDEYLENPLLVSLLYAAFDHKQIIPLKKHLFYRQVYEAYFDSHDLAKGINARQKHSGLDIDDFNRVLRYVGYECLVRLGVQFDKDTILSSIDRARAFCGNLKFGSNDFLKDLMTTVPLFTKDGPEYKWAHKSLMEYFAARYIFCDAKQKQDKILTSIYNSKNIEKYINVLDIYFDIDFNGFSKNITLPLFKQFLQFHEEQMKKNEIDVIKRHITQELIEERIGILFLSQWAFFWNKLSSIDFEYNDIGYKHMLEKFLKNPIIRGVFHFDGGYIWFAYNMERIIPLVELLCCKQQKFFKNIHHAGTYGYIGNAFAIKEQPFNKIITINLSNGKTDNQCYRIINNLLIEPQKYRCYLSQEACAIEIERIEEKLAQNEEDIF